MKSNFTFFFGNESTGELKKNINGLLLFFALKRFFTFCLDAKSNKKIKPENQKLENYLEVPLRSPSRSSFVLNSRTAAVALLHCFLCFLFKGGVRRL